MPEHCLGEHDRRNRQHAIQMAWAIYRDERSTDAHRQIAKETLIEFGEWAEEVGSQP